MRVWLVMLLGVVCGCSAGLAMTWVELARETVTFESVGETQSLQPTSDKIGPKAIIVGGAKFDFGTLAMNGSGERAFEIRNDGDEPLEIQFDGQSCGKCIQVTFPDTVVQPGEKCEIVVNYAAKKEGPRFNESAVFTSNDPRLSQFMLEIVGVVTKPIRLFPEELTFGSVSSSDGASASVMLLGYHAPEIQLVGFESSNPSLKDLFEISSAPLPKEQVIEKDANALCGLTITVTAKPGLPLGPINQIFTFTAKSDEEYSVDLAVTGEVVGDMTIIGKGFNTTQNALGIGFVKRGEGKAANLYILVKGQHRNDVKISVAVVDPAEWLTATVGEGEPVAGGKAIKFPLTIALSKDAPPQHRLGDARGKMAKVLLETTHPATKQIPINVRYVIE